MARRPRAVLLAVALLAAVVGVLSLVPALRERAQPKRGLRQGVDGASAPGQAPEDASAASATAGHHAVAEEAGGRVHGVVTGRYGVLWCARVVAYRTGTSDLLAEAFTDPEGKYAIDVDPTVAFDLAVEPAPETWLLAARRPGLTVAEGEDREEDVALAEGVNWGGRIVDADGHGLRAVDLVAARLEDVTPAAMEAPRPEALVAIAGIARTDAQGAFRIRGLVAGAYALMIKDPEWMFPSPVTFRTGGPEVSLTVLPALAVDLAVSDVETEEPVRAFTVKAYVGDRVVLEAEGASGAIARRIPWPGLRENPNSAIAIEVSAPGFVTQGPVPVSSRGQGTVWLSRPRPPNVTIRASFDDGAPYRGGLFAFFKATKGRASGVVVFERTVEGTYRVALPYGQWDLVLFPTMVFGGKRFEAAAEVGPGRDAVLPLVMPGGGAIHLTPPPGVDVLEAVIGSGGEENQYVVMSVQVPREGAWVEGIPPGVYRVGCRRRTELLKEQYLEQTVWFRDVTIAAGNTEEIALPAR